jgi:hypothetical protein
VFKNGGVFAPMVPTIHCSTCKERRHKRMSLIEQEQEKGSVLIFIFLDLRYPQNKYQRSLCKFDVCTSANASVV